ncbi:hypothetical protein [Paenibacillus hexagrammi]|uniref:Uncharacterized protein n=1 Tax=Paenibacillus hexagrammi TaxID=2908839 RepID=A0ABY3SKV6_9BACL|nr:hypothetical protein [Paenibacillus sp. YPD9-1]UJF34160.1 hypothetical protein L0M14_02700 [Paenibacillus sp. YPD9-1]
MKRYFQVVSPILLVTYLLISRYVPMNDFIAGLLAGISVGGSICTLVLFGRGRRNKEKVV